MPTGFPIIDKRLTRGIRRTDFICILGGAKGKKSWACIYLGREALLCGLKVLHITHENSAEDTEMRYDMMLGGLTSDKEKSNVEIENIDDEGNIVGTEIVGVKSVWDLSQVTKVRRRVRRFGGELIIKKYPMGSCTIEEIRRYLDYLEMYEGFIPDVVINDYVEAMKLPKANERREAINEVYIQSKGLADERKIAMITVSQTNRAALRKKIPDQKDFAEDIRKLANVDLVLAEGQTKQQSIMKRMQMWVLANRHGPMDFGCVFATNLDIGQLCVASWPIKFEEKPEEDED
jgi:replicative DNA helicase